MDRKKQRNVTLARALAWHRSPQAGSGEGSGEANRMQGLAALSLGLLLPSGGQAQRCGFFPLLPVSAITASAS